MVARELGCKKVARKLLELYPEKRFFTDKEKGVVSTSWKDIVHFSPAPAGTAPTIQFSDKNMDELGVDVAMVRRSVHGIFADQRDTEWCL
eukprot:8662140-Pyramimonas_sp.AAC.1